MCATREHLRNELTTTIQRYLDNAEYGWWGFFGSEGWSRAKNYLNKIKDTQGDILDEVVSDFLKPPNESLLGTSKVLRAHIGDILVQYFEMELQNADDLQTKNTIIHTQLTEILARRQAEHLYSVKSSLQSRWNAPFETDEDLMEMVREGLQLSDPGRLDVFEHYRQGMLSHLVRTAIECLHKSMIKTPEYLIESLLCVYQIKLVQKLKSMNPTLTHETLESMVNSLERVRAILSKEVKTPTFDFVEFAEELVSPMAECGIKITHNSTLSNNGL